jgi:hypothetical protein
LNFSIFKIKGTKVIYLIEQYFLFFLFLKYYCKKVNFKIIYKKHVIIKIIIIIILKPNSVVDLRHNPSYWLRLESQVRLTWVNMKIKIVIIIFLKFSPAVHPRQGPCYDWSWKMIIIIVLKPDLEANSGQCPGHISGGST